MNDFILSEKLEIMKRQIHKKYVEHWSSISPLNLSMSQSGLMLLLEQKGMLKVSDLAEYMSVSLGGMTALCDKLEERNLIERVRDQGDRRIVYMKITERGRMLAKEIRSRKNGMFERIFKGIPVEDLRALEKVYASLLRNLDGE